MGVRHSFCEFKTLWGMKPKVFDYRTLGGYINVLLNEYQWDERLREAFAILPCDENGKRIIKENDMATCKDCLHYEPCWEYGNILDPIHGGVKCDSFKPAADFVPKSETEKLVQDSTRLVQENETLKDNNEHLAVMLEEAKSEVERLQAEKDALIKNYAECMKDYAREIFAEIERIILDNTYPDFNREHKPVNIWKAKEGYDAFDEFKKKYTEGNDDRL